MNKHISALIILFFAMLSGKSTTDQADIIHSRGAALKGGLVSTHYNSLEELSTVIHFEYLKGSVSTVNLTNVNGKHMVTSSLSDGVNQTDLSNAKSGSLLEKIRLVLEEPFIALNRKNLMRVYYMARRQYIYFGEGDCAFYDIAEHMVDHIYDEDKANFPPIDLSEKGYLNTFNHVTAQAMTAAIFSDKFADFVADLHERQNMSALTHGQFTEEQLESVNNNPIDNYVDMINNEWGQELGASLKKKYDLSAKTIWSPSLLANVLNDIQSHMSWTFEIGFKPFHPSEILIRRYSDKLNLLMHSQYDQP